MVPELLSLPVGHVARRPRPADADDLLALAAAYDSAVVGRPDVTADDVRDALTDPRVDPDRGAWVVADADSALVGWGRVVDQGVHPDGVRASEVDVTVHPSAPGEVGRVLLSHATGRASHLAVEHAVAEMRLDGFVMTTDERTAEWFSDAGFSPVRRFSRLQVPLSGSEAVPSAPAGVTVRVADGEADRPLVHRLVLESFAEHFAVAPEPYDVWLQRTLSSRTTDATQWYVAEVDGEPAGVLVGTEQFADEGGGWVRELGVLPQYRGRGLGRLLLRQALAEMARRGRTHAGLGVDTANDTGAPALYESLGFRTVYSADCWRRGVPAAA